MVKLQEDLYGRFNVKPIAENDNEGGMMCTFFDDGTVEFDDEPKLTLVDLKKIQADVASSVEKTKKNDK